MMRPIEHMPMDVVGDHSIINLCASVVKYYYSDGINMRIYIYIYSVIKQEHENDL